MKRATVTDNCEDPDLFLNQASQKSSDLGLQMRPCMWFPTMWHFDMCRLGQALQPPFKLRNSNHRIFKRLAKALIRLRLCAGCSEALLVVQTTLLEISCCDSFLSNSRKLTYISLASYLWNTYMPYLRLCDKISQNLALLKADSH